MQKYFISDDDFNNKKITSDDAFHISNVMRFKPNDSILIGNNGKTYLAVLKVITKTEVSFEIVKEETGNKELPVFISIFQGYPKGDKLEDVIKYGTEYGVSEFVPTIMKRSIFKLDPKKKESKIKRFNTIAKESSEQSYRSCLSYVSDIKYLKEIDFSSYNIKILCYEEDAKNNEVSNLKNTIKNLKPSDRVAIVIGPEGGVDDSEVSYLLSKGFIRCALGPRILRTEVALYYVLSAISYEMELK
jgi:16S rRNA (uracil1498-N3)-methyltransferase